MKENEASLAGCLESLFAERATFDSPRGRLIVLCGFDGAGKTTQIDSLFSELCGRGRKVIKTRQPTDWYRQQAAVKAFLSGEVDVDPIYLSLLSAADRRNHLNREILPALHAGYDVLCDRYVFSALALFTHRGVPAKTIAAFNQGMLCPDFSFLLDVPNKVLRERLLRRQQGIFKREEKHLIDIDAITKNLRAVFSCVPGAHVLNGELPQRAVTESILSLLDLSEGLLLQSDGTRCRDRL